MISMCTIRVGMVFQAQGSKPKIEPKQMLFATKNITFMGHVVSKEGTKLDLNKIEAILHFPESKMIINIRLFLGLTWYYLNYVQGYSRLAAPLFELTKKC